MAAGGVAREPPKALLPGDRHGGMRGPELPNWVKNCTRWRMKGMRACMSPWRAWVGVSRAVPACSGCCPGAALPHACAPYPHVLELPTLTSTHSWLEAAARLVSVQKTCALTPMGRHVRYACKRTGVEDQALAPRIRHRALQTQWAWRMHAGMAHARSTVAASRHKQGRLPHMRAWLP